MVLHRKRCKGEMLSSWTVTGEVVLHCALMGRGGAMPSNISNPRYLPVLVVSLSLAVKIQKGVFIHRPAAEALIKNKTISCETHTDQASQHHQGRGTNGK